MDLSRTWTITAAVIFLACRLGVAAPTETVDELWALEHLIAVPQDQVPAIIARLERQAPPADDRQKLALGILHVHQYIWHKKKRDSDKAEDYLSSISGTAAKSALALVYKGMSSSFLAKRRTVFGVGHLKDMRRHFESIPRDHPSWFIRFLRGTTLYQVGQALPSLWPLKEHKQAALKLGRSDLNYVLGRHRAVSIAVFDPAWGSGPQSPVPQAIHDKVIQVLEDS